MKQKLLFSLLLCMPLIGIAQNADFSVLPLLDVSTTIKDGQIEAGVEFNHKKESNTLTISPAIRIPLTSKDENLVQLDRFSNTAKGILHIDFTHDATGETGNMRRHTISGQFEAGVAEFKYYPTGQKPDEMKSSETSYGFEVKYTGFYTKGASGACQFSPQFRLRYSNDWKAAKEVGVVNPANSNGVVTTTNMVIAAPSEQATFSPALAWQIYPGHGSLSYSPAVYCDFTGKKGSSSPFQDLCRVRIESWVFFYPTIKDNPNVKIGLTPFVSIRASGTDDFNPVEAGGMITVKFGTTFLQFL